MYNQEFLDLYNELDSLLRDIYNMDDNSQSAIMKKINELKQSSRSDKQSRAMMLDSARNIRNFLAHDTKKGVTFIEVSSELVYFIRKEIELLKREKKASNIMIPFDKILYCENNDNIKDIITKMREKRFTNVPILNNKYVIGIFNENILTTNIVFNNKYDNLINSCNYSLADDYSSYYAFTAMDTRVTDLEYLFEEKKNNKRLEMLFVTQNGLNTEKLLGIITVYDVIENN